MVTCANGHAMTPATLAATSDGHTIGAYRVVRLLGRGGMGSVYECRHHRLQHPVAVKVLHPQLAGDPVAAARFLREGQAGARIRHPYVTAVFDIAEHEGIPYLVMELVQGQDLATYVRQHGPLPIAAIVDTVLGAVAGVAAAHEAGVIHRDLKPSNVRVTVDHLGRHIAKVLDFGISKFIADVPELTETNQALGTTSYMAPEQVRSAADCDARSDGYSLGVILYECLTGRLAFDGASAYDRMHAVLTGPLVPPRAIRADVPEALDALILRAMHRNPDERFQTVRDLGRALAAFASYPFAWQEEFAGRAGREPPSPAPAGVEPPVAVHTLASVSLRASPGRRPWAMAAGAATVTAIVSLALASTCDRGRSAKEYEALAPAAPPVAARTNAETASSDEVPALEPPPQATMPEPAPPPPAAPRAPRIETRASAPAPGPSARHSIYEEM